MKSQMKNPGFLIIKLRENQSLTQEALADLVGAETRTVQRWEAGGNISEAKARSLGRIFELDYRIFLNIMNSYDGNLSADCFVELEIDGAHVQKEAQRYYEEHVLEKGMEFHDFKIRLSDYLSGHPHIDEEKSILSICGGINITFDKNVMTEIATDKMRHLSNEYIFVDWGVRNWQDEDRREDVSIGADTVRFIFWYCRDVPENASDEYIFHFLFKTVFQGDYHCWMSNSKAFARLKNRLVRKLLTERKFEELGYLCRLASSYGWDHGSAVENTIVMYLSEDISERELDIVFGKDRGKIHRVDPGSLLIEP